MKICQECASRFEGIAWRCPSCGWTAEWCGAFHRVTRHDPADVKFEADFFDHLAAVESRHFWFEARNALIAWALARYFPPARTFLEVGCGTGQVVVALQKALPALKLTASEAFAEGLLIAARRARAVELVQADARALPYDAEFDVVGAFDVLEHIPDDADAVRQLARATRPGGGVIVTVPQHGFLWSPLDDFARHQRRYSRDRLVCLLELGGLRPLRVTSFVSLLMPALLASRLGQRGKPVDPLTEYRISPGVNRIARAAMGVERGLIRAGVSLPVGGSLLAVARRPA